ncbi:amphi-Trp domain-containing protein [Streptomyces sp. ms191]|uniref:amphi-Trp domain-containing protein n=1 Tax=Streptomyces sp. ms191 TaxID=1827978 RepID=UPI0011CEB64E|nr:amphi-Trp domain-containing protein [Streptomyces sp. ms191]TXS29741.1 amphi-Trp domain-containing protein [Streptomyces sp. ms191]
MKDLKFEQKRSLSRLEAADQLSALAEALRQGGEAELELGSGTLSMRIPEELRSEVEFEVGDGEIELEIEFTWPTRRVRKAAPRPPEAESGEKAVAKPARSRKSTAARPAPKAAGGARKTKRAASKSA